MKTKAILSSAALILAATLSVPAPCRAQDTVHGGNYQRGGDPLRSFNQTSTGAALSSTFFGAFGQGSMSVSHGAGDLLYISTSGGGKAGYRNGDLSWTDTVTINPNDPALLGTSGTAKFTYHLDGSINITGIPYFVDYYMYLPSSFRFGDISYHGGFENSTTYSGTPLADLSTMTDSIGFTFGTPFTIKTALSAGATLTFPYNGTADVRLSLRAAGMSVTGSGGQAVNYTSTSPTGSAAGLTVASGGSFAGLTVTNTSPFSHGSTASLLGGVASADSVVEATFLAQAAGFTQASDILDVTGIGHDKYVLQLSYDPAIATTLFGNEANATLLWLDPVSGLFENAVFGNSDGGLQSQAFSGAYDPATESALGSYGVDTVNHVVWAVVDHNSEFGVGSPAPEPSQWILLLLGGSTLAMRRRRATPRATRS